MRFAVSGTRSSSLLYFPWASEDMTTAKLKSDNGIVDPPQLDVFS